jgi:hypothetical protein
MDRPYMQLLENNALNLVGDMYNYYVQRETKIVATKKKQCTN